MIILTSSTVIDNTKGIEEYVTQEDKNKVDSSKRKYYRNGDTSSNGDTIDLLLSQNKNFVIFMNTGGGLCWEIDNVVMDKNIFVIGEAQRLNGILMSRVARKYHFNIQMLLGGTLASALNENNEEDIEVIFKPVQELIDKALKDVEKITSWGPNFQIYKTSNGGVSFWHKKLPDYLRPAVAEFNQLSSYAKVTLPEKDKELVAPQMAFALSVAFNSKADEDVLRGFKKVDEFINTRALSNTHFWYIFYNSVLFLLMTSLALLFYFYFDINKEFVIGSVGGLVGAFLSTLTRIDKLSFNILAPFRNVILQGYSRLLVGSISGLFIIVASHSNLILGTYSNSLYSLAVFSIISGFSERFVPDLISSISSKQLDGDGEKTSGVEQRL
ncbi:TPA: hypothetical protein ACGXK0_003555 [Bacillus cereus]|uniref:hypothetical protein n=1 Tax=Bacillus cereus TaxID=1396 RepID=UPI000BF3CC00|nr:hypothetical protein [Bacillus cereus]PFL47419.1 hypothetical protein COJ34_20495 [Bacillus cereus]PFQ99271.1 hypothetical protein COK32_05235 [Bacillus cereus]PGY81752.1 hypothetical protein COE36_25140 [Bacillus cereus]